MIEPYPNYKGIAGMTGIKNPIVISMGVFEAQLW